MTNEEALGLWRQIEFVDAQMPRDGGCVTWTHTIAGPADARITRLYGDRVGLLRLGWAIVRYAMTAEVNPNSSKAEHSHQELFAKPSDCKALELDLDEKTLERIERELNRRKARAPFPFLEKLAKRIRGSEKRTQVK